MSDQPTSEVGIREVQRPVTGCPNKCAYRDGTPKRIRNLVNQGVRSLQLEGDPAPRTRAVKITIRVCDGCGEQISRTEEVL